MEDRGLDVRNAIKLLVETRGLWGSKVSLYIDSKGGWSERIIGEESVNREPLNIVLLDWNRVYSYGDPEECYSLMIEHGGASAKEYLLRLISSKYGYVKDIAPLKIGDKWVLHVISDVEGIPYYVMGDGFKNTLVHMMLVSAVYASVLLLEEPELHQHPGLMELIADAIVESSINRENQVFISTHSLEFIDYIIGSLESKGLLDRLCIYRFSLEEGALNTVRYSGDEARDARRELDYDLRG